MNYGYNGYNGNSEANYGPYGPQYPVNSHSNRGYPNVGYDPPSVPPPRGNRPNIDGYTDQVPTQNVGHIDIGANQHYGYAPPSGPPPATGNYAYNNPGYHGPQLPNSQSQSYGFSGGGSFSYQYSTCQGKRKALLIGINYVHTPNELQGCINDVLSTGELLKERYGYKPEDMVIMTDTAQHPRAIPTRQNMIDAMRWLVSGAQPNDSLFFHYSGHGGQAKDLDGDEADGYDETIYPLDHEVSGQIIDDEMHEVMVRPLPAGCRLTAIFDSCHSGGALDLPFTYSTKGVLKEPNMLKESGMNVLNAGMSYMSGDIGGIFNNVKSVFQKASGGFNNSAVQYSRQYKFSPADVISISGCKDSQTSADTNVNGFSTGALSYAFREVITQNPQISYLDMLRGVRHILQSKYSQLPQLSCSHPLDMNLVMLL
ncbi:metacaspase Pca1 [Schizosaccharomyces cryophilus OY26]|uniref:Metacaspase Pca1 n=1 Tax=Schizosaccharomyces cryophilus (strain OY26 / ATCC MYA-4695 / CBS 11777 / NBRC 106824 / NRRL Y48691) TaxID=653667 RepID=S9VZD5_SCHCR|nr:metacaspase Pca1 [Schizosaccharomyces cryophilus OY26]EPY51165.1 metacaspase Pca1 [Schizosaccharomyces cryophilus OY26]